MYYAHKLAWLYILYHFCEALMLIMSVKGQKIFRLLFYYVKLLENKGGKLSISAFNKHQLQQSQVPWVTFFLVQLLSTTFSHTRFQLEPAISQLLHQREEEWSQMTKQANQTITEDHSKVKCLFCTAERVRILCSLAPIKAHYVEIKTQVFSRQFYWWIK